MLFNILSFFICSIESSGIFVYNLIKDMEEDYMTFDFGNVEQITIAVKTLKMAILTYWVNFKLLNKKIKFDFKISFYLTIMAFLCVVIRYEMNYLVSIMILIIGISILFSKKNFGNSILTTIISLSINYIIEVFAIIIGFEIYKLIKIN